MKNDYCGKKVSTKITIPRTSFFFKKKKKPSWPQSLSRVVQELFHKSKKKL